MILVSPPVLLPPILDDQRTRHFLQHIAIFSLSTAKYLLLIAISSRQYLNLIHWLPVFLSLEYIVLPYADEYATGGYLGSTEDAYELVCRREEAEIHRTWQNGDSDTLIKEVNMTIHTVAEILLCWSYLKVPARIVLISSTLPYAFTLYLEAVTSFPTRKLSSTAGQYKAHITAFTTVFLTAIHIMTSTKLDSYSFLNLVMAVSLKTTAMLPRDSWAVQHVLARIYGSMRCRILPYFSRATGSFVRLAPTTYLPNIFSSVNRIVNRLATTHFTTTATLFLLDFLFQSPKPWSFLTTRCWGLAMGFIITHVLLRVLERSSQTTEIEFTPRSSRDDELSNGQQVPRDENEHFRNTIRRGAEICACSFFALLITSTTASAIDITATDASSRLYMGSYGGNAKTVQFTSVILLCWLVLWYSSVYDAGISPSSLSYNRVDSGESPQGVGPSEKIGGEQRPMAWPKGLLVLVAFVPLALAVAKHTMSGTMLGRVYDHFDGATLRHERGSLEIRGLADSTYPSTTLARQEFTHDNPDLPTVDVVIAYYNEPTSALRRLTSRLKKELTWARVNLIIYHNGIAGFDDQLASRFTNGALDSRVADEDTRLREVLSTIAQLKAETRADAVLPRKNVGRDMGVFLDHITHRWGTLAQQTIFLQADVHEAGVLYQRMRLLRPDVGYMSFSHYGLFEDPLDLLNMYPFPEMAIAWDLFHPGTSLPKTPILTAYRGQMVISRDRIKQTERQVWEHTTRILVSERDDAEHVDGFGWKDEPEGPSNAYFIHIIERAWPLMVNCYNPSIAAACPADFWSDNANSGCFCSDIARKEEFTA